MTTTRRFQIVNPTSGIDLGTYAGATEAEALDRMAQDAGYRDYAHSAAECGETVEAHRSEVVVTEVEDGQSCAYCGHDVPADEAVPAASDDEAWADLATGHAADCEWIATRAHRLEA